MLFNRPAALIDEDTNATFAYALLVRKWDLAHSGPAARLTLVKILGLFHHGLLKNLVPILVYLLLDDILGEHLIVELQRLLVDQLVVEAFAISWLDNVTLGVNTVLVANLRGRLMLALELLLLLNGVLVVLDETPCGRNVKL